MVLTENEEKNSSYVFTKRIEFKIKDSEETDFVVLREFNMQESKQFQQAAKYEDEKTVDTIAAISKAEEFFTGCLVDSSFVKEDGSKATNKQVYDYLKKSSSLFQQILTLWLKADDSPFQLAIPTSKR